jgi:hypothetical protein
VRILARTPTSDRTTDTPDPTEFFGAREGRAMAPVFAARRPSAGPTGIESAPPILAGALVLKAIGTPLRVWAIVTPKASEQPQWWSVVLCGLGPEGLVLKCPVPKSMTIVTGHRGSSPVPRPIQGPTGRLKTSGGVNNRTAVGGAGSRVAAGDSAGMRGAEHREHRSTLDAVGERRTGRRRPDRRLVTDRKQT